MPPVHQGYPAPRSADRAATARPPVALRLWAGLRWSAFGLALALASLLAAWYALAAVDFGYPVWHDALGIDRTIARYGPRNDYRPGFEDTTKAERARLFGAIVRAVHDGGDGLAAITYHGPDGEPIAPLLRGPEIVHLRAVATLVGRFELAGWVAIAALAALVGDAVRRRERPPPGSRFALGAAAVVGAVGMAVAALGPVPVFYGLHERLFRAGHQWFFWYEESLMSTMMKAPDLFGAIAVAWLVAALAVAVVVFWITTKVLAMRAPGENR